MASDGFPKSTAEQTLKWATIMHQPPSEISGPHLPPAPNFSTHQRQQPDPNISPVRRDEPGLKFWTAMDGFRSHDIGRHRVVNRTQLQI
ncbi:hypothetical protein ACLOJK_004396 [Asimina triloba]